MSAGVTTDAAALALAHEPVAAAQVVAGSPTTGIHEIDETTGVWEMTPGRDDRRRGRRAVRRAVAATRPSSSSTRRCRRSSCGPGSVVRLEAGMRTVWTVRETLRKVYVAL